MSFSIDEVRDTIGPDIEGFLGRAAECARALLSSGALAPPPTATTFTPIEECGHTVHGTSSLVSVRSLAESAALLEQLAGQGRGAMAAMALEASRARRIADLCQEGASAMRSMLALELDHQPEAAMALATSWAERAARAMSEAQAPDAVAEEVGSEPRGAAQEPETFSFADMEADPPAIKEPAAAGRSVEVGRGAASAPEVAVPAMPAVPREAGAPGALVLDLDDDWDDDGAAQPEMEAPGGEEESAFSFDAEGPRPLPDRAVEALSADADPELLEAFADEVRAARSEAQEQMAALLSGSADASRLADLERLYHALKGAALALGLERVSHRAAELQQLSEQLGRGSAPVTRSLLLDLERRSAEFFDSISTSGLRVAASAPSAPNPLATLGADRSADRPGATRGPVVALSAGAASAPQEFAFADDDFAEPQPPPGVAPQGELIDIFRQEAAEARLTLQGLLQSLLADPDNDAIPSRIEGVLHTLKGAAATIGLTEISGTAEQLRRRVDQATGTSWDQAFVEALARDTSQIFLALGLPGIDPGPLMAEELSPFFVEEAQQILKDAARRVADLKAASPERSGEILAVLGQLFHRLKGSAVIIGEDAIADAAAHLQDLCQQDPSVDTVAQGMAALEERLRRRLGDRAGGEVAALASKRLELVRESVSLPMEPEIMEAFHQEAQELLDGLEKAILELEESAQPKRAMEEVLSLVHTLKGVVFTIGLGPTGKELHLIEDFLDGLQHATILPPMRDVATLLLEVRADVRRNLKEVHRGYVETSIGRVEARIARVLAGGQPERSSSDATSSTGSSSSSLRIEGDSQRGSSQVSDADVSDPGERRFVRVAVERLDTLMNLAGELVVSRSRLMSRLGALRGLQLDLSRSRRRLLEAVDSFREQYEFARLDEGTRERGVPTYVDGGTRERGVPTQVDGGTRERGVPTYVDGGTRERGVPTQVDRRVSAPAARESLSGGPQDDIGTAAPWTTFGELELDRYEDVHILARKLAEIGSDIGEVDGQLLREFGSFSDDSEGLATIVSGMQSEVTRARMVPLEAVFSRLRLPVRDAAARERKVVRVVTRGEDVAVDKTIADALFQPLLHLVRNSVVHGVEAAEQRADRGKPETGTITLSARQESGQIVLEIGDDGAGLDLEALHARGVTMGLIAPSVPALDPAVKALVFAAGLSTRRAAGDVSGRGVGCDVVRRSIERLNGDIRVETVSRRGTTFLINLPLTLAITKALIIRHEGRAYAIPLYFAERILNAEDAGIVAAGAERRIRAEGTYLALRGMSELLGRAAHRSGNAVVVLRVGDKRIALEVDAVAGQEEVVVKGLGDVLSGHPLFAGVTIRGTGELTLIVDVPGILEDRSAPISTGEAPHSVAPFTIEGGPAQRAPEGLGPEAREVRGREPAALEPLRVLFVDDSVSVRKVAESTLAAAGARVTVAVDGIDALEKLRAGSFDLVFTDLEMPRMHGYDLVRELRFLPQYANLPILIVSSRSQEKHQVRARELGANDYITKPFSAEVLHEALRRWGKRRPAKEAGAPPERTSAPPRPTPRNRDKT